MTKRTKIPLKREAAPAAGPPRGRPATGLINAVLYAGSVNNLMDLGMPPTAAVREVAKFFRKREEHIWACRKKVADEIARRKKNNNPLSVWSE